MATDTSMCTCGYVGNRQYDLQWAIGHRRAHLKRTPDADAMTRRNLDEHVADKRAAAKGGAA